MGLEIKLKCGREQLTWQPVVADWAGGLEVLQAGMPPAVGDSTAALNEALANPHIGPSLAAYLSGRQRVVIVVSDHTRAVGYRHWLPALLDAVNRCGLGNDRIELLVAVGLHDPEAEADTRATLGEAVCQRVKVTQHQCREDGELQAVTLVDGRSVRVNRRLVAGVGAGGAGVILTGGITFHYHAGFGGGRKAVFPGCAAYDDVLANHKLLLDRQGPRGRNPHCQPGRLDGNPIYAQSVAVLKACPPMFLVNVAMAAGGQVARFFCGDPIDAHRVGCDFVWKQGAVEIGRPADLVVAGAGGYPKDGSLYQAHKAFDNAARAVRPGGAVVLAAGLQEGLGPKAFRAGLALGDIAAHRESLFGEKYSIPSQTCLACREKVERAHTWLVGPPAAMHEDLRRMGFELAPTVQAAVGLARAVLAATGVARPRVVVMPDAGAVLPTVGGVAAAL